MHNKVLIKLAKYYVYYINVGLIFAIVALACEDGIQDSESPELFVTPEVLIFPSPAQGESTSLARIDISNLGKADLVISNIELIEDDQLEEISILDRADWAQEQVVITAGASRALQLQWNVLDAQADRARLIIRSNGGSSTVTIETPDLDPELRVSVYPDIPLPETGGLLETNY